MRLEIELRCILFPLIILEMFLQLDWSPPLVNSIDWTWFGKTPTWLFESTCLYKGPTVDSACQSKNHAMRPKELPVELRDRIVSRHSSGEGYQNISAVLNVPQNTVASIFLKWKKFGTTKTLPRAGRPAKLSNQGRRALVSKVTNNLIVTLTELQSSYVEMGEPSRRTTISAALHQSGLYGRVARRKPLLSKFAKCHIKDSKTMRNNILWSDGTKIEL